MKLYRFSPINDELALLETVEYVAKEATKLLFRLQGYTLPIKYVTVFAHYEDEYKLLLEIAGKLGKKEPTNNGFKFLLTKPLKTNPGHLEVDGKKQNIVHTIESIRIRKPDPHRMQVGCCDYEFDGDYVGIWSTDIYESNYVRRIVRSDIDMVEFFDPDVDVLAYIVGSITKE